jgi:hypothetical protein
VHGPVTVHSLPLKWIRDALIRWISDPDYKLRLGVMENLYSDITWMNREEEKEGCGQLMAVS